MTMESDLRAFVIANGDVTALVGTRMFPQRVPQGQSLPAIRYTLVVDTSDIHLTGVAGRAVSSVQLDCYSETYAEAVDLAEKVRVALVANNNGDRTMGSTRVYRSQLTNKSDEPPFQEPSASDKWIFNRSLDFEIEHIEAAPA